MPETRHPSPRHKPPPHPPPRRLCASPTARNASSQNVRSGFSDGPQHPYYPRPRKKGTRPRPHGRKKGGRGWATA